MTKPPNSDDIDEAALPEEFLVLTETLRSMSDERLLTDDELYRFFELVKPAQNAALDAAIAEAKAHRRQLTRAERHAALVSGLLSAAGSAAREVWGACIGELVDGKRPQ
jgi:hypothetical protein